MKNQDPKRYNKLSIITVRDEALKLELVSLTQSLHPEPHNTHILQLLCISSCLLCWNFKTVLCGPASLLLKSGGRRRTAMEVERDWVSYDVWGRRKEKEEVETMTVYFLKTWYFVSYFGVKRWYRPTKSSWPRDGTKLTLRWLYYKAYMLKRASEIHYGETCLWWMKWE